ncbi:MAG TPA: GNAT family protein [Caldilineaceae bacterium]|nr:GNAT family protein [Caldilineaceae bacterium]
MLQGEKVLLRALRREDLPRLCVFNNDLEVELAGGGDPPFPQSLERLQAEFDSEAAKGGRNGPAFAIEADGQLIGQCALFQFDEVAHTAMLGIGIGDKSYWGRGYGGEAIRLLLDYAFRLRNLRRVWLSVNSTNERAFRAYRGGGFVEEGRLRQHVWSNGPYSDLACMGVRRTEWQSTARP